MENIENLDSQQTETTAQNALSSQQNNATPEAIADALMNALDSRNKRVETGIVKSMAEQYGMTDAEIAQILGHSTTEVTEEYLRITPALLQECALEVEF